MALSPIQGMVAEANTVIAFHRVNARLGGGLRITAPYGAGRTWEQQAYLYNGYQARRPGFNYAARPGTSNHEIDVAGGIALDVYNWASYPTLREVMRQEGFIRDAFEQWHYNYRGVLSPAHSGGWEYIDAPEPPKPTRRNTMTTLYYDRDSNGGNPKGATFALAGDGAGAAAWQEITDYDYASNLAHVHGRAVPLSAATFQIRKQQYLSPAPVRLIT